MFKRFKVTGINENPKKPKRNWLKYLALGCVMALPAFALLKTGVLSMNKNVLAADQNKYDIVADLDGGKFEMGTTPEFTKMDNGNWLYKYKPVPTPTKLPIPVKDGYEFTGWTVSAKPDVQKEYSIPAWHKGNLNIRANWKQMSSVLLSGGSFAAKIRNSPDFENITHIKFIKGTPDSNGIDLSEKQDKSVMGSFNNGVFSIACRGEIFANPDSSEMFRNVWAPSEITFDNFNTSNVTNMSEMFYVNFNRGVHANLIRIHGLEKFNTSKVTNMFGMFSGCSKVESLNLSSFSTSRVRYMTRMFEGCESIKTLDVSNFDTSQVMSMAEMFSVRWVDKSLDNLNTPTKLVEIVGLEDFNTSRVRYMTGMFANCSSIEALNVSNFDTSSVQDMNGMFFGCWALRSIDLTNFDTSNVESMVNMFGECSSLTTIDVSNFNTSRVTNMSDMFATGRVVNEFVIDSIDGIESNLVEIKGFENLNTSNVQYMSRMFCCNLKLNKLNLKNLDISKVEQTNSMFRQCVKLNGEIIIDNASISWYDTMFEGCSSDPNAKFIVKYTSPETKEMARKMVATKSPKDNVYLYEDSATLLDGPTFNTKIKNLSGYSRIEFVKAVPKMGVDVSAAQDGSISAYLDNGVLKIACIGDIYTGSDASNMFKGLNTVTNIGFTNFNSSNATNMSYMFSACNSLLEIDLSKINTSSVTTMHDMFAGCRSIKNFDVSVLDTRNVTSLHGTFYDCDGLINLDLNSLNTSKVTDIGFITAECDNLQSINMDKLDVSKVTTIRHLFKYCRNLETVILPQFDFTKVRDAEQAFAECDKLISSITINGGATTAYKEMFYKCSSDPNAKFIVNYTEGNRTLAQNMVNTKTTNDHVYLGTIPSATLVDGRTFKRQLKTFNTSFKEIRFISGTPNPDGVKVSIEGDARAHLEGEDLVIVCADPIYANPDCSYMFSGHSYDLESVNFSNFNTSKVTDMSNMFEDCRCIKELNLSNFDTSKVTDMSCMFRDCRRITNMDLSGFDTSKVTDMSHMFFGCYKLTSINVSMFNTARVTSMCAMFESCHALINLNLSNFNTSNVTDMDSMFSHCDKLKDLDLSSFNTENLRSTQWMFSECVSLNSSIMISNRKIEFCVSMFYKCSTESGAKFVVKYENELSKYVAEKMVATKSSNSNVYLDGTQPQPNVLMDSKTFRSKLNLTQGTAKQIPTPYAAVHQNTKSAPTPNHKINITLNNGPSAQYPVQKIQIPVGKIGDLAKPDLNPKYAGQFGGYFYDKNCTIPVKPNDVVTQDIELYAKW